jgi:3-methyladenine DNA glycosylase AlkC
MSGRRDKLSKNDFSPRSFRLATASKSMARERIALSGAFPNDKDKFVLESIQHAAKDSDSFQSTLDRVQNNDDLQDNLMEYV